MKMKQMIGCAILALMTGCKLFASVDTLLADDVFQDYHGWLKYLEIAQENAVTRFGATSSEAAQAETRLNEWVVRIEGDVQVLNGLRGVFEWAYESEADDSGQPFTVSIPASYDPERSYQLIVDLHGSGVDHIREADWMMNDEDNIALAPFGRSSGSGYRNLSEADVLDAIAYVKAHWNIDEQAVHIQGSSMGGHGTFSLSNRYPHLFASAMPGAARGIHCAVGNWLHMPFYSTHSQDDYVVPVVMSRLPLQELSKINDNVVIEEIDGYGHATWTYLTETGDKPLQWAKDFRAPLLNEVYTIDYTATDGVARRGYWAEIVEWGSENSPAHFRIEASHEDNAMSVELENIDTLHIELNRGPFDLQQELSVSIGSAAPQILQPPLADDLYLIHDTDTYTCTATAPADQDHRLHYPGGPRNLYSGEPLLIVWGTQGDDTTDQILETAAQALRRSPHPSVSSDTDTDRAGYVHLENRYGILQGKPDIEVTEEDMQRYHLVLIGNTSENAIAARIADQLPVRSLYSWIITNDGVWWTANQPVMFLCYYNPLASNKLIYWVSSRSLEFYQSGAYLTEFMHPTYFMSGGTSVFGGRDLVIYEWPDSSLIASRNFDSNWNWEPGYGESPRIQAEDATYRGIAEMEGLAARMAVGADFSLITWYEFGIPAKFAPGKARFMDIIPDLYNRKIALMEMTGAELLNYKQACDEVQSGWARFDIVGNQSLSNVAMERSYTICLDPAAYNTLMDKVESVPGSLRYSETSMQEAFKAFIRNQQ